MSLLQWLRTPKGHITIALMILFIIASIFLQDMVGFELVIVAVGCCVGVDVICNFIKQRKHILPDGAIITGLIIALIVSETSSYAVISAASAMAILSKHILVYKKKPIFNPAMFGLLLSFIIFESGQSWWGALGDFPVWTIVFVLISGYAVTHRANKYPQLFSFLGTFFILLLAMNLLQIGEIYDILRSPFINSSLFFAFFMMTDPPTSPTNNKHQIVFGILVAVVSVVVYGLSVSGLMYLFIGLLVGNLYRLITRIVRIDLTNHFAKISKLINYRVQ